MTTAYLSRISFAIPTADLAAFQTALNAATGLASDLTATYPTETIGGVNYYVGDIACTDAQKTALLAFFDASSNRRYNVRAWGSDAIVDAGPTTIDVGRVFNAARMGDDAANFKTIDDIKSVVYARWVSDYVTNVTGTWQPQASNTPLPSTINSPGSGCIYNPQVFRGGSYVPAVLSEGQSFGLILSALNGDKTLFSTIWNRTKLTLQTKINDKTLYFARYFDTNQPSYGGSAPDGDLVCALALAIAYEKGWGSTYLTDMQAMAADMWTRYVASHGGRYVFCGAANNDALSSPHWNNDPVYGSLVFSNYQAIQAFRKLAQHDTARSAQWSQLITDSLYFVAEAAKLHAHKLPPESFRVRPSGAVEIGEQTGNRLRHWNTVSRFFLYLAWAAAEGHQASIDFIRNQPCAQRYRETYSALGTLPSAWNTDGTTTAGTDGVMNLAAFAAMESVINPGLAKRVVTDIQALYHAGTCKWHWDNDTNFVQFGTFCGLLIAGKILGARPALSAWPASAATRKLFYQANANNLTLDTSNRIAQWNNALGTGYNLTQATDANKPIYVPSDRFGLPCVRFDGVDDFMQLTGTIDLIKNVGSCSLIVAARLNSLSALQYILSAQAPTNYRIRFGALIQATGKLGIEAQTLDADAASTILAEATASQIAGAISVLRFDINYQNPTKASGRIISRGSEKLAATQFSNASSSLTSNTNLSKFTIGGYNGATNPFSGDIYALAMTTGGLPSDQAWADIRAWLKEYGVK